MDTTEIVGVCALCAGAIQSIPQFYKLQEDNNMSSFSLHSILIGLVASILSLIYGILKSAHAISMGGVGGIVTSVYLWVKFKQWESSQ